MYYYREEKIDRVIQTLCDICDELKINVIAGPVLSGVIMVAAVVSRRPHIMGVALGKPDNLYRPSKHCEGVRQFGGKYNHFTKSFRVMLVDDLVSSGESLIHAYKELKEFFSGFSEPFHHCATVISSGTHKRFIHDIGSPDIVAFYLDSYPCILHVDPTGRVKERSYTKGCLSIEV